MRSNYNKIKRIVLELFSEEDLKDKLIVVGGIVPYLLSDTESEREHSDIDIIVKQDDMWFVRNYLEIKGIDTIDSMKFSYNRSHTDYGTDAMIDSITVNFAPYEINGNVMVQRNFMTKKSSGLDVFVTVTMKDISIEKVFCKAYVEGVLISTFSPEMVKVMKEKSKKKKDKTDIKVIEDYGYDKETYFILKKELNDMTYKIVPKNRLLRLFLR